MKIDFVIFKLSLFYYAFNHSEYAAKPEFASLINNWKIEYNTTRHRNVTQLFHKLSSYEYNNKTHLEKPY